jgi:glycosyltransferase involved in cell wall biosynthesis
VAGAAGRYFADRAGAQALFDTLLDDADTLAAMRDAARRRHAEAFTWPAVLDDYERLLASRLPDAA